MSMIETVFYRGYEIAIGYDEDPINPFEFGDCEPLIIVNTFDRHGRFIGFDAGEAEDGRDTMQRLLSSTVDALITERRFADILRWGQGPVVNSWKDFMGVIRRIVSNELYDEWTDESPACRVSEIIRSYADVAFSESENELEDLARLLRMAGTPALVTSHTGFSQGDYMEILCVLDEDFYHRTGCSRDAETAQRLCESAPKLYANWAFGECYRFTITDDQGNELDNMGGFVGDHEESGLLPNARVAIDAHIREIKSSVTKTSLRAGEYYLEERQLVGKPTWLLTSPDGMQRPFVNFFDACSYLQSHGAQEEARAFSRCYGNK